MSKLHPASAPPHRPLSATNRRLLLIAIGVSALLWLAMPIFAQESYYWCYAQHPDLSYYDHPPMVAWLIWLGTGLFGDGAAGLRAGTFLCGMGTLFAGLQLLRMFDAGERAVRAWLLMAVAVPTFVSVRFLTNPDPALCCFWMLTMVALWKARRGSLGWWLLAGLFAGCALLSKYTAAFLAVGGAIVLLFDPQMRRQLRRPGPYLGVVVAAVTFLPVLLWNFGNDFESFRFQTSGRWDKAELTLRWFGELLGGQLLVLNPVVAIAVPLATIWLVRRVRDRDATALWLLAFGAPLVLFFLANSLFVQVKINWLAPAALPLLLGVALWFERSGVAVARPIAVRRGAGVMIAAAALMLLAPLVEFFPQRRGSSWTGWHEIAARAEHWEGFIDEPDGLEGNCFFFAGDYRDAAQLTRNLKEVVAEIEPGEVVEPTMAQNVLGRQALQFDHWQDPRGCLGQDAIFVVTRPEQREDLVQAVRGRFDRIERVERVSVKRLGFEVLAADIYVCRKYRGPRI